MKKKNVFYILSIFVLSSIFMATSCKDDDKDNNNKPTSPSPTENPMYKNKINELRSYIGLSDSAFKAIMTDSLGLVEDIFINLGGRKIAYYDCPDPKEFVYEVFINPYLDKVSSVRFYYWLDYDTLVKHYEGFSKELSKSLPLNSLYEGAIYDKQGSEYLTSNRDEFQTEFQLKKGMLRLCGERYEKDSIAHLVCYEDSINTLNHSWTFIGVVDMKLIHNRFTKKNNYSFLDYKSPLFRRR